MAKYLFRRVLSSIPVLLVVSILIFGGVRFIPGDVCRVILQSPEVKQEQCDRYYHALGMDRPIVKQYFTWMSRVVRGDLGTSLVSQRGVWSQIKGRLGVTIELTVLASLFSVTFAIPIGVYSALNQDKLADYALRLVTIGWLSMPGFWVATLLLTFPAKWWGYAPPAVYHSLWSSPAANLEKLFLPTVALGLSLCATLARITRSTILEVLRQDYVLAARAKGLANATVLSRHVLKNAMLPIVTLLGLQVGALLGGAVILESIYGLPGLGNLLLSSVVLKDYTQIQGIVLLFGVVVVALNIVVDLSYAWFDPRVRLS